MEQQHLTIWGNVASTAAVLGSLFGYVPAIAGVVALVWYFIQIYESRTAQRYLANRRHRQIMKLRARLMILEATQLIDPEPLMPPDDGL